ncbi:MAG: multidrug effflux MFS transporter [Gammaproteobacteria bacterium]|nr:multidrug effflux MFS transporter [Gammaproteobacteria bacterium]
MPLTIFSLGFIYPNCFAQAMEIFPDKGYASALIGSAILIGVSAVSAIISHYHTANHALCLSLALLILSLLSIASYLCAIAK